MRAFVTIVVSIALLVPQLAAASGSSTLEQIRESGTIRIGYRETYPPMSFKDENGKPVGYSVDLCTRVVTAVRSKLEKPDIKVEYVPVTSNTRFTALVDNKIDILCGSTTKTLSRSELVDFSQLTFVTGASLLSMKEKPVSNISDLQGKKVAVVKDTTTIDVLKAALKESLTEAEVVEVDTAGDGLKALEEGKADAYSSDQVVLIGLVLTSKDPKRFLVSNELFSFEPFALTTKAARVPCSPNSATSLGTVGAGVAITAR